VFTCVVTLDFEEFMVYDPLVSPDGRAWLSLSESERLAAVLEYHRRAEIKLPSARLHAALHVTVENQLAERYAPAVAALDRLTASGMDRHDAVHAIASVAAAQMQYVLREGRPFDHEAYERDLTALTAEDDPDR
jgi:hypothetical protein